MRFIINIITTSLAVVLSAYLLPGVSVDSMLTAILIALVLAILNLLVKPILVLFTLPITVMTLGLFLLVINAVIVIIADKLVDGFTINGFWWAVLFSIVLTIVVSLLESLAEAANRR
jgi:putative membrane protein